MTIWRIAALLLLIGGSVALAAGDDIAAVAVAKDDKDKGDKGNSGNGNGNKNDEDGDGNAGNENSNGKAKGNEKKRGKGEEVAAALPYTVEVTCEPAADGTQTTCVFTGIAPEGAKKVGHVDLPASDVCAEVVGGEYEYVDPDPNTRVTGYTSHGSEGTFTLVLDGTVSTGGQITYWIKAGGNVYPAIGPGLACEPPARMLAAQPTNAPTSAATMASTPTASPTVAATFEPTAVTTGEVLVVAYACPEKPADPAAYDWFGLCAPDGTPREFSLAAVDGQDAAATKTTSETGEATFGGLAPGSYDLTEMDQIWCHAKSDNVTPEGTVVVEPGQRTTVWAFHCGGEPPK